MSLIDGLHARVGQLETAFADVTNGFDDLGRQVHDLTALIAKLQRSAEVEVEVEAPASATRSASAAAKTPGKTAT